MNYKTKIRVLGDGDNFYHVMSRITERRFYLGDTEKEQFCSMMRRVAAFSGIEVLTYCVLDNHFHILLKVPRRVDISDEVLLERMRLIYSEYAVRAFAQELAEYRADGDDKQAERLRKQVLYRMYNLSEYMKTLKQRYAIWYNGTHNRHGHLWDDRFKSVLVEGCAGSKEKPGALWVMAQYIELNAIRAGIVNEAGLYRWCGFAEALAGNKIAQQGIMTICDSHDWNAVKKTYGWALQGGEISTALLHQYRVRYFVDGVMLGSAAFVEDMFQHRRHLFCSSRKTAARKMRGEHWNGLCTVRDFRNGISESESVAQA